MFAFLPSNRCLLCHALTPASAALCSGCLNDFRRLFPDPAKHCPCCAAFSTDGSPCGRCRRHPPPYIRLWVSAAYRPPLPEILHQWKHLRHSAMLHPTAAVMLANPPPWLPESGIDAVLAMPVSRARRLWRGFNQSGELAAAVARRYRLPLLPHDSVFRQHRPPQSTLNRTQRLQNVRHIFQARSKDVKNRKILLVDDITTTGVSLAELAQTLNRTGAAAVFAWVAAKKV